MSAKVTVNNASAGHRPLTGGIRCPGDCLRQNKTIFSYGNKQENVFKGHNPYAPLKEAPCPLL